MHHIRPHQVLGMKDRYPDEIKWFMPSHESGCLSGIESIILLKLARCVDPAFVFEFGTYRGYTTTLLLENLDQSQIHTLDLPGLAGVTFEGEDRHLAETSLCVEKRYCSSPNRGRVKQIYQDSMRLEPEYGKFQFVFIDANHELKYARNDTEKAFEMIGESPSCIVWHDYGNSAFPELTQYLDDVSATKEMFHVEETKLVFWLSGLEIAARNRA